MLWKGLDLLVLELSRICMTELRLVQGHDVVLLEDSRDKFNGRLGTWRQTLEVYDLCVSGIGWLKWRIVSCLLRGTKAPPKLKGKFHQTLVKSTMLYGTIELSKWAGPYGPARKP
ncbi:hypothetical protein MTR_4g131340 [Medicago truncatula]|uniref:Uncharacterized protein n=1 Tax=Medicago truncatula TaxID=3880 RepID=G7JHX6_MEDTR|nr:hypothetical protein MTR_4g131340 [Medicago truncatula]